MAFATQKPPGCAHLSLRFERQMISLLPRVVLQPLWGVLGAEQGSGGRGRRLDRHGVAAREEERESSEQTLRLPSVPEHGSTCRTPNTY